MWLVFSYIWLPFMIIPVYAALERIPDSLLEASRRPRRERLAHAPRVVLPLALPGIIAGSIFTFSLTLGDFITPLLIGGANSNFIGNVIYDNTRHRNNLPFAAAFAIVPIAIMTIYLLSRAGSARSRRCDGDRGTRIGLGIWTALVVAVPLDPARDHRALRVQLARTSRAGRSRAARRTGSASPGTTRMCATRSGCR